MKISPKAVIVVGQVPPPFGGQAMMIRRILDIKSNEYELIHVPMQFSKDFSQLGKFNFRKLAHVVKIIIKILRVRFEKKASVLYYPPSADGLFPLIRDAVILMAVRPFFSKTIFHFHAAGLSDFCKKTSPLFRFVLKTAFHRPTLAIQLSEYNPADGEYVQALRTEIVPYGIEDVRKTDGFKKSIAESQSAAQSLRFLFVGLLNESKGVLVLLEAARICKASGIDLKVTFVGQFVSGEFESFFWREVDRHQMRSFIEITGPLSGNALLEQYELSSIFCFPSYFESESFGLVVLEAMQHSLPVISTQWRGIQSLVIDEESGFLVPIKNASQFAEKMLLLAKRPDLRSQFGSRGRALYLSKFTLQEFTERMNKIFKEI